MFLVSFAVLLSVLAVLGFCLIIWGVDPSAKKKGICLLGLVALLMSSGFYLEEKESWRNEVWATLRTYQDYRDQAIAYQFSNNPDFDHARVQMVLWSERYNELANSPLYGWAKEKYLPQRILVAYQ